MLASFTRIGASTDSPVIALGSPTGTSDFRIRELGNVLYEPADVSRPYKFFYTGYSSTTYPSDEKIHYAYSTDGTSWTKSASNPVVSARTAEDPYVINVSGTYYLFAEDKQAGGEKYIRRWHSADCETWVDDGQITGLGDAQSPLAMYESGTWYLFYEQYPTAPQDIMLATSSDGLAWTPSGSNPVFTPAGTTWADTTIVPDDIYKLNGVYYMAYHGYKTADGLFHEGLAKSTNLTSWTDLHSPFTSNAIATPITTAMFIDDGVFLGFMYYGTVDSTGVYKGYIFQ